MQNSRLWIILILTLYCAGSVFGQDRKNKIGAYYFDGWSGKTFHITPELKKDYPDREPVWGWITSEQKIIDQQIQLAADKGLAFFSFCWYFKKGVSPADDIHNRALSFYKKSANAGKIEYCLLVANHAGYDVGPDNWEELTDYWTEEFKHPQYLKTNKKPILIFFESGSLIRNFGSEQKVSDAFEQFRKKVENAGLNGVSIAVCAGSADGVARAESCGADLITGYNYHSAGFKGETQAQSIQNLHQAEPRLWSVLAEASDRPYIPVSTIGWDPRPWANQKNNYLQKPYFNDFSAISVKQSVTNLVKWMNLNQSQLTAERIGLIYAWNENGEGAWLTPGKTGIDPSKYLKPALKSR